MKILVINAGSSSMKYQLINMENEKVMAKGLCERIGIDGRITLKTDEGGFEKDVLIEDHGVAFEEIKKALLEGENAVLTNLSEISAVGHRVVQGGSLFNKSVLVDESVIQGIESLGDLAPLHNPPAVAGIKACIKAFGAEIPQAVVFDTSFHSTMPEHAFVFPVSYEYYEKYKIRRYGFHGTSHRYVSGECARLLNRDNLKIITCHLGNGCSVAAIDSGRVIDTSMGFTPLDGCMMGTRSGAIDPSVALFIMEKEGLSPKQMSDLLNKESGLLGISGVSSDNRDVSAQAEAGNQRCKLALKMQRYNIKKLVGAYAAALGGVDAVVFTGGIGENVFSARAEILEGLDFFGILVDEALNDGCRGGRISPDDAPVQVLVIPTDEELVIARDTTALVEAQA